MNIRHSWNFYLKRTFSKISTWIILLLQLGSIAFFFWTFNQAIGRGGMRETIDTNNDLFQSIFFLHLVIPFGVWTFITSPVSWLLWWQIDDAGQTTQTDGTDLFFLSTEIPTSRKQVFWGKVISFFGLTTILYLLLYSLPAVLLAWKGGFFTNLTNSQIFSYLSFSLLVLPLFFFLPLFIFFFSLCSLKSVWYTILKWLLRLSIFIGFLIGYLVAIALYNTYKGREGTSGLKIINWAHDCWLWLGQNYLLVISVAIGVVFLLACLTLTLAYKKFQKEDLD